LVAGEQPGDRLIVGIAERRTKAEALEGGGDVLAGAGGARTLPAKKLRRGEAADVGSQLGDCNFDGELGFGGERVRDEREGEEDGWTGHADFPCETVAGAFP